MRLAAKSVILELLSAAGSRPGPARLLVAACSLFGISENSTRVTLARLLADGTLETTARGTYRLGAGTQELTRQVTSWRTLEAEAIRWDGAWVCAFTAELPRSDRAALRRRGRALRLLGFRELARGLWVRPDNLRGGVASVSSRLASLGLDPAAPIFEARFDPAFDLRARSLWDGRALASSYRTTQKRLERWLASERSRDRDTAARESFLLGREALKQVLFDPLLPDALVDVAARRAFFATARRFDEVGRRIWARRFGVDRSLMDAPDAAFASALRHRPEAVH